MTFDRLRRPSAEAGSTGAIGGVPGKRTLIEQTFGTSPPPASQNPSTPGAAAFDAATTGAAGEVPYRAQMEASFGMDFGDVHAHVGQDAALGAVGARGAARGDEVAFASATPDRAVVAHELAHVAQQRHAGTAAVAASRIESQPDDAAEREADAIGAAIASGATHVDVRSAPSASLHFDKGTGAGAQQMIPITVRVFSRGHAMVPWHGLSPEFEFDGVRFTARREEGGDWNWSDSEGERVLLHDHKGDKGRTVGRFLAEQGLDKIAYLVVVDFGTVSTPIDTGTGSTEDNDAPKAKTTGNADGSESPAKQGARGGKAPSAKATANGKDNDAGKDGDWQPPNAPDILAQLHQTPDGSQTSKGRSTTATRDGDSVDTHDDGAGTGNGSVPNAYGGGGQWSHSDQGRKDGEAEGDADKRSLVHNDNAEKGDAANANIPEDGAKSDGRAGGEADKGSGGAAGGGALWKLITIPAAIGVAVDLGIILKQGDLAGLSDGLVSKAMTGLRGKALRAMIETDIDRFATREVANLEKEMEKVPDWEYLSDAAKASKRAQMRYAVKDSIARSVANDLDQRIKELESTLKTASSDVEKGEVAAEAVDGAEAELKAAKRTRAAMKDFGPKPGTGSFRELEERTGKNAAKGVAGEVETAEQAFERTRSYWTTTSEFRGMKVYERNDLINPDLVVEGETNLQRMERGVAPYGPDGKSMELHHLNQANEGPVVEITNTFHRENSAVIHINPSSMGSGIDRDAFDAWKAQYWQYRASVLKGG